MFDFFIGVALLQLPDFICYLHEKLEEWFKLPGLISRKILSRSTDTHDSEIVNNNDWHIA